MSRSVLVVDDEKNIRVTLADILTDEGYDVSTADCGERAVKMCAKRAFDVVLMDVRMPGIDGIEAFRRIREKSAGNRVILMSAYALVETQKEALSAGVVAFLRKPLDVEQLLLLIGQPG